MNVLKKSWDIISTIILVLLVVLAVLLAGVRLIGYTPYSVLSSSMEPTYHVGSLIYVKKIDTANIKAGDPITFVRDESLTIVTHRVIGISDDGEYFTTKGDANEIEDGIPVYYKNILGVPQFTIPYLGFFSNWIKHPPGMYIGLTASLILVILLFLPSALRKAEEADRRDAVRKEENSADH